MWTEYHYLDDPDAIPVVFETRRAALRYLERKGYGWIDAVTCYWRQPWIETHKTIAEV